MRSVILLFTLIALALAGCSADAADTPAPAAVQVSHYPDLGAAPELTNDIWINTAAPLRLESLRGKVVLIDMWTFG
jgi:hypothetical protein